VELPNTGADVRVSPDGRFVYASNRGHDSLAMFAVQADGTLVPIGHAPTLGRTPRCFSISPNGRFLVVAHQNSGSVIEFQIDPTRGTLEPTGTRLRVSRPVCVVYAAGPKPPPA
jgi:6-phosphogluconolactonase